VSDRIPMIVCQGFQPAFARPIAATLWLVMVDPVKDDDAQLTAAKTAAAKQVAELTRTEAELMYVVAYDDGLPIGLAARPREYDAAVAEIPPPTEPLPIDGGNAL
jgi:hypothetical protein